MPPDKPGEVKSNCQHCGGTGKIQMIVTGEILKCPACYRWAAKCDLCNLYFASIDELTQHCAVSMNKHRDLQQAQYEQKKKAETRARQINSTSSAQGEAAQGKETK